MKTPVSTITCPNPRCQRQHALFWYVGSKSRQLSYRCDRVERQGKAKHDSAPIPVRITATLCAPPDTVPTAGIPEELSAPVAQKLQDQAQRQFPLMKQ